ncbi:MAG TPA: hypothetical protein VGK73_09690 [Polyangiaceae bacterium]
MGRLRALDFTTRFTKWLPCAFALLGCAPEIGDSCNTSVDCSPAGDRLCDTTQPGGYCTIYNCEDTTEDEADAPQGACPEEAACVIFAPTASARCSDPEGDAPYQRTFCMFRCENDTDCRADEGYHCLDLSRADQWAAIVIDRREDKSDGPIKVCSQYYNGNAVPEDRNTEVCTGPSQSGGS